MFPSSLETNIYHEILKSQRLRDATKRGLDFNEHLRTIKRMATLPTGPMSPEQVADYLQLDKATIYRWLRGGKLGGKKLSDKCWRIMPSDVYELLRRGKN